MCGIFGGFSKPELEVLANANAYRGQHSFSITGFCLVKGKNGRIKPILGWKDSDENAIFRHLGSFTLDDIPNADFYIAHIQAPTGIQKTMDCVHPADILGEVRSLLWHNGIIKEHDCDRLRKKQQVNTQWDTMLLLNEIKQSGLCLDNLSEINGSFSCVGYLWETQLYLFRNSLAPMYIGDSATGCFSSVPTNLTPNRVKANVFYLVDFNHDVSKLHLIEVARFQTKENPYVGLEDDDE